MEFTSGLFSLGLDEAIIKNIDEAKLASFNLARVTQVNKNSYLIHNGNEEVFAELSGKFLYTTESSLELPAVGDWVYVQVYDDNTFAVIHDLVPRKSLLKRKTSGKKIDYQLIAANIDFAVIVQSLDNNYNIRRLERYLVMSNEVHIIPVVLLSKSDLVETAEAEAKKAEIEKLFEGMQVIHFSNIKDDDTEQLEQLFVKGKTYCLLGSSGVGKSTLINNLLKEDILVTQAVREKDSRGKHTTTHRELIFLRNGAIIIDNPGMRELGLLGNEEGLNNTFDEFTEIAQNCKYQDCTHTVEKGCAILEAVEEGIYPKERYDDYIKLYKEMKYNEMSYVEKRQKDKQFGKMVQKALKIKNDKK